MASYRYLVCRHHATGVAAVKNLALPMQEPYVYSTFLAKHCSCSFELITEDSFLDDGYEEWNQASADGFIAEETC